MLRLGSKVRLAKNSISLRPAHVAFRFSSSSVAGATDINPHIKESPFKDFGFNNFAGLGLPNPACNVFDYYERWSSSQPFPVYKYTPVMSQAMYDEREKAPVARANAYDLVHGIEMAFQKVRDHLMFHRSQPVLSFEELIQVGTVAANGDRHIGELVAKAIEKVGPEGAFFISDKINSNNKLVFDKGMSLDFGLISPFFITNKQEESCVLRNPFILIHENKISSCEISDAVSELGIKYNNRPLLVITGDIEKDEIKSLIGDWDFAGSKVNKVFAEVKKYST